MPRGLRFLPMAHDDRPLVRSLAFSAPSAAASGGRMLTLRTKAVHIEDESIQG